MRLPKHLDRERMLADLDKVDAEESLMEFMQQAWHVLEPGRQLIRGWALDAIAEHLQAVTRGEIRKLLINVPPGMSKSLLTSVLWPAWEWGPKNNPDYRYLCFAYNDNLTIRDNRKCRNLILSNWYQERWGDQFGLVIDQNAKTKFETDRTGFKIASSVGGVGTGERGDRCIIDDPHAVKDADSPAKLASSLTWFTETLPTRINDPKTAAFVVIMQRVHERDVSGLILEEDLGYEHLMLPMEYEHDHPYKSTTCIGFRDPRTEDGELLFPERFTPEYIEDDLKPSLQAEGGDYAVASQLQQRPAPRGGGMMQKDWFTVVDALPERVQRRCRGWDLAGSKEKRAAYTAGVLMSRAKEGDRYIYYIEHVTREKGEPHEVESMILDCADNDPQNTRIDLPQDPGQAGKSQMAYLVGRLVGFDVHYSPESGDKVMRASPLAAQAKAGNVRVVKGSWNKAFFAELEVFPNGTYKDQVDAASRAFAALIPPRRPRLAPAAPKIVTANSYE